MSQSGRTFSVTAQVSAQLGGVRHETTFWRALVAGCQVSEYLRRAHH
jgi:hypothetical protein